MISKAAAPTGQYVVLGLLAVVVLGLTVIQARIDQSVYEPYFGKLNPIAVIAVASILGFGSLGYLMSREWFEVVSPTGWWAGIKIAAAIAPLFFVIAVIADLTLRFPQDTNVHLPDALFFYPSVAFFVEVCLHAVPFAVLVALLGGDGGSTRTCGSGPWRSGSCRSRPSSRW